MNDLLRVFDQLNIKYTIEDDEIEQEVRVITDHGNGIDGLKAVFSFNKQGEKTNFEIWDMAEESDLVVVRCVLDAYEIPYTFTVGDTGDYIRINQILTFKKDGMKV